MSARVTPYLNFGGNAREAMEFYHSVFGGTLDVTTYADLRKAASVDEEKLVAHSMLSGSAGVVLMASDITTAEKQQAKGSFSVALGGDKEHLTAYWERLTEEGVVTVPFAVSAWGALHGQCVDRFGTAWLVNVIANNVD